jgi:ankyrin repeat protein
MTRQLSAESSLENLKREAKRWLGALRNNDSAARTRLERALSSAPPAPGLRDVQLALAREHGLAGWTELRDAVARVQRAEAEPSPAQSLSDLLSAAERGDANRVRELLDAHPEIVSDRGILRGHSGLRTALHFAVNGLHETVIELLLDRGANPNIRDESDDATPLHFAAEKQSKAVIQLLVAHGADTVGAGTFHELNVLGWATVFGMAKPDIVDYLLAHGAQHTMPSAVAVGNVNAIRALVAESPNAVAHTLDSANRRRTMLHLAVVRKQVASLRALLELGADIDATDAAGLTALDVASLEGEMAMADLLIEHGARIALPAAAFLGRTKDIERILAADHTLLWQGRRYGSLIVHAAEKASAQTIDALLKAGASANAVAEAGAAVDEAVGYTALHSAAFSGNLPAVQALLRAGANVRAREERYCGSPAAWARYAGHHDIAAAILDGEIDIFDAIEFDLAARVPLIVSRDPASLTRPLGEYVKCEPSEEHSWRNPAKTPLDVALEHGHIDLIRVLHELLADEEALQRAEVVARFLCNASPDWRNGGGGSIRLAAGTAARLLQQYPGIAKDSIFTAVVCGDTDRVQALLANDANAANETGGPRSWTPLLYLASARLPMPAASRNAPAIARLLLERGANANAFYPGGNPAIHYTVLTCVLGMGEHQAPQHPCARELVALLFEYGAEPYDAQLLYDVFANHASRPRLSDGIVWLFDLIHAQSVKLGREPDWRDSRWGMLDMGGYRPGAYYLLRAAVSAGLYGLTEWLLLHGTGPNTRAANPEPQGRTLYAEAAYHGRPDIANLLERYGADTAIETGSAYDDFLGACWRTDRETVVHMIGEHPDYLQNPRALLEAVRMNRVDVVSLLLDAGFSPDMEDHNEGDSRPLHAAAFSGAVDVARLLVARGADIDAREKNHGATPLGVASWAQQPAVSDVLGEYSHDIFGLTFAGKVQRVRELLQHDPALAASIHPDGKSLLMWLPDDEAAAVELAGLFLAYGTDTAFRDSHGVTALHMAEQRALSQVVALLRAT